MEQEDLDFLLLPLETLLNAERHLIEQAKVDFSSLSFSKVTSEGGPLKNPTLEYHLILLEFMKTLILCRDEHMLMKFRGLGVSDKVLKWFIDLDVLAHELTALCEGQSMKLPPAYALLFIRMHLQSKALYAYFLENGGLVEYRKKNSNMLFKTLDRIFTKRNKDRELSSFRWNEFERLLNHDIVQSMEDTISDKDAARKLTLDLARGDTSLCLSAIFNLLSQQSSNRTAALALYPLFRLIDLEHERFTREQYYRTPNYDDDISYEEHQEKSMKKYFR